MSNQHLDPNSINLTYGHPDGVPVPEPYSWKKALTIANAVWAARETAFLVVSNALVQLKTGGKDYVEYAEVPTPLFNPSIHHLAGQIIGPGSGSPTAELLAQFPQLCEVSFTLPLQSAEAHKLLWSALDLEARNLWHQVFQDAKARGVSWRQRNLTSMDYNGLGLRLSMSEVREANRTTFAPKGHAAGATAALETEDFNYRDARYLARLIIKHHLNHELAKETAHA